MGSHRKSRRPLYAKGLIASAFVTGVVSIIIGCSPATPEQVTGSFNTAPAIAAPPVTSSVSPTVPESIPTSVPSVTPSPVATEVSAPQQPSPVIEAPAPVVPAAASPTHLAFPALGISVATHPMDGTPYVLDPPHNGDSYWLNNYGLAGAGSTDTAYIIGHSCYGPGCTDEAFPFNRLSKGVASGQIITVTTANGSVNYQVTESFTINKNSTRAEKRGTWDVVPGRLVLLSCYTEDPLNTNVIVFATMIEK